MSEQQPNTERYWGSEQYDAWSARIVFPGIGIPFNDFRQIVVDTAARLQHRYTGFITRDETTGYVTSFTRTIYPRRKYPTTSIEQCTEGMQQLASVFDVPVEVDAVDPDSYRALLGLYIGQQNTYSKPSDHSVPGVQEHLRTQGLRSTASAAEVFTVRFTENDTSTYSEPTAVVTGPLHEAPDAVNIGYDLGQERFTIEMFTAGTAKVRMIETTHCKEPEFRDD